MKKRPFLLLEVLIALLLIELFTVFFLKQPILAYRKELANLEELERQRIADWSFSEVKEKLFKNEIPWESLPQKRGDKKGPFPLEPPCYIDIPSFLKKKVERSFSLHYQRQKTGRHGETYRLLEVKIFFSPPLERKKTEKTPQENYVYRIALQRLPIAPLKTLEE